MKRLATILAASALATGVLTGCGGGDDYCDAIKSSDKSLESIGNASSVSNDDLTSASDAFGDVADVAPDDIKDAWQKISDTLDGMVSALDDAGVSLEDIQDPSKASDLDPEDLKGVQEAFAKFSDVTDSVTEVTDNAKQECDIDLSGA